MTSKYKSELTFGFLLEVSEHKQYEFLITDPKSECELLHNNSICDTIQNKKD